MSKNPQQISRKIYNRTLYSIFIHFLTCGCIISHYVIFDLCYVITGFFNIILNSIFTRLNRWLINMHNLYIMQDFIHLSGVKVIQGRKNIKAAKLSKRIRFLYYGGGVCYTCHVERGRASRVSCEES